VRARRKRHGCMLQPGGNRYLVSAENSDYPFVLFSSRFLRHLIVYVMLGVVIVRSCGWK
jgi:hypothetical protein